MYKNHLTPIHLGKVLQDELQEIDISSNILARHIGVSPSIIQEICCGERNITARDSFMAISCIRGKPSVLVKFAK